VIIASIDDLAWRAEVEAEILRALSGMTSTQAQEFLLAVVLKIRRAHLPVGEVTVPAVSLVERPLMDRPSGILAVAELRGRIVELRGRVREIVDFIRLRGSASGTEVADHFKAEGTAKRSNIFAALCYLNRKGILRREDGVWSLTVLDEEATG
jgi:hypothetical protein